MHYLCVGFANAVEWLKRECFQNRRNKSISPLTGIKLIDEDI